MLLLSGALVGIAITIAIQAMWSLACDSRITASTMPSKCPGIELAPMVFGCLFGAVAADLIWSRRRRDR